MRGSARQRPGDAVEEALPCVAPDPGEPRGIRQGHHDETETGECQLEAELTPE